MCLAGFFPPATNHPDENPYLGCTTGFQSTACGQLAGRTSWRRRPRSFSSSLMVKSKKKHCRAMVQITVFYRERLLWHTAYNLPLNQEPSKASQKTIGGWLRFIIIKPRSRMGNGGDGGDVVKGGNWTWIFKKDDRI